MKYFRSILSIIFLITMLSGSGMTETVEKTDYQKQLRNISPKVFIDCSHCDLEYIRTNMTFVNYVRDTKEAEVYILITRLRTGSGGREYTIEFSGQGKFKGKNDKLIYSTKKDDTDDEVRKGMLKSLKLGMIQYIKNSELSKFIEISFKKNIDPEKTIDRWNKWVFNLSVGGWFRGEESYKSRNIRGSVTADRVSSKSRISIRGNIFDFKNTYIINDEKIESTSKIKMFRSLWVGSLGPHWSIGGTFSASSTTYRNKKLDLKLSPSIEFNVFPYSVATKKQFRFMYGIDVGRINYFEETIYGKKSETLLSQKLSSSLEVKEKWGSIDASLSFSNYFHDLKKYSINLDGSLDWRIFKGLSFEISGGYSIIHDQLYLPKGDMTTEEILLRTSAIETSYNFYGSVGLRFTFGSIYNNVVNPRFGF